MITNVVLLSEASHDVDHLYHFEKSSDAAQAKKKINTILEAVKQKHGVALSNLTTKNRIVPEIEYKAMIVEGYVVIYREEEQTRIVNRILHLQRDLGRIAKFFA